MNRKCFLIVISIVGILSLVPQSCANNNELDLYGILECDTTHLTWDSKISAILQEKCVKCHGAEVSRGGVRHDSYEFELVVINDGRLRKVINDPDPSTRMPKNEPQLDSCKLKQINLWLDNGAPEN